MNSFFYLENQVIIASLIAKNIDFLPKPNNQNLDFMDSDFHPYHDHDFNFPVEKQLFEDFEQNLKLNDYQYEDPQGFHYYYKR